MNSDVELAFKTIIKHVSATRPLSQCVHFENGDAVVTDAHRMIRVRDMAPKGLVLDLNLADFSFPDGFNYPDTGRLMPKKFITEFDMSIPILVGILPTIKAIMPYRDDHIDLIISESQLAIEAESMVGNVSQKITMDTHNFKGEDLSISCNYRYLLDAIKALTSGNKFGDVHFGFNTVLQPFVLTRSNVDYLITPVRVF